jgi:superfamily II DNA or RNA helicase
MTNIIQIENNYSWLHSQDDDLKFILWKALRCRARGYFHNVRYKMKLWDGYDDFFKKDSGRFLTGLLPEVKLALKHKKIEYQIKDTRELFKFAVPEIDENFIDGIKLRDYQIDYANQVIKNHRGLITSPPGSGKTNTMKAIIKALPPKIPTLILANKKSLVDQNYDEIKSLGIDWVGRLYGDKKEPNYITCATSQSAHLMKSVLGKIKVLIVDEIHEMMSKIPKRIYAAVKNCTVRVGMSGTPFKFGGEDESQMYDVKGWFGPVFYTNSTETGKLTTMQLQERDILSSAECLFYRINQPQLPYDIYLDAVTNGISENNHFHNIVTKLVKKLSGRTLIIVERIEHGDRLQERIPGSLWVRGKDNLKTRKGIIEQLKTQDNITAIATSGIFNTGINVFIHNLINAAGGQADHAIIQRFGRGLRRTDDKQHLKYFDFVFEINEYLEKHSWKRIDILEKEGYQVKVMDVGVEP